MAKIQYKLGARLVTLETCWGDEQVATIAEHYDGGVVDVIKALTEPVGLCSEREIRWLATAVARECGVHVDLSRVPKADRSAALLAQLQSFIANDSELADEPATDEL